MSFMDKFQSAIERLLVPLSKTHMRSKRCFYFIIPINDGRIIDGVIE